MSEILFKSLKNHDIQGLCLPCDIIYVKIIKVLFLIIYLVHASQKITILAINNMKKTLPKNNRILVWQMFTM